MGWLDWLLKRSDDAPKKANKPSARRKAAPAAKSQAAGDSVQPYDSLADAFDSILRSYAQHAFDVNGVGAEETRELCDKWARHLLAGGPHPDSDDEQPQQPSDSSWRGVRHYFLAQRKREEQLVKHMGELIWLMLKRVHEAFVRDGDTDAQISTRLGKLRHLAKGDSLVKLQRGVVETIALLETSMSDRRDRYLTELAEVGDKVKGIHKELTAAQQTLEIDELTQLATRPSFHAHIVAVVQLAAFTEEPACLLRMQIDRLEELEGAMGQAAKSVILPKLADTIVRVASRRTDFVARYDSDSFAVVLGDTSLEEGQRLADRIIAAVRKLEINVGDNIVDATFSVGLVEHGRHETAPAWLRRADDAMDHAQQAGGDRVVVDEAAADAATAKPARSLSEKPPAGRSNPPAGRSNPPAGRSNPPAAGKKAKAVRSKPPPADAAGAAKKRKRRASSKPPPDDKVAASPSAAKRKRSGATAARAKPKS